MCGICGKLFFDREATVSPALVKAMADTIEHRGPDDEGYYVCGPVGLGFRRLSIIDLSTGHQPLSNEDGTVWIVFNGEIYNYQELRKTLIARGHRFATHTDTEVIVHLYEDMGQACVEQLRGMFGFAIWDSRNQTLFLARDRVGIKPMYYSVSPDAIWFASELKAILADPDVPRDLYPEMVDRLLTFKYLPGAETLLKSIQKLDPGCTMTVSNGKVSIRQYWDLKVEPSGLSLRQAQEHLSGLLEETVDLHMISDVPVGFLLSGGVDSTAMLSIASRTTRQPTSSFTVGFDAPGVVDERPYARLAANRFGSTHHEISISSREFQDFLPEFVWHMEEPVCEPPAVALYYVSRLARESVKVLISGEGGDEAFGGYQMYRNLLWLERFRSAPGPLRRAISASANLLRQPRRGSQASKYLQYLDVPSESAYYGGLSNALGDARLNFDHLYAPGFRDTLDRQTSVETVRGRLKNAPARDRVNRMLYVDTKTWLADDLLVKADKITMANSIELRVPLLDHKLLEFAASLPGSYKVRGLTTKYLLKKVLAKRVPPEILKRKKVGFPVPFAIWLRTDMKTWVSSILLDRQTLDRGYFQRAAVERLLSANSQSGACAKELFSLVALELWHRAFLKPAEAPAAAVPALL